MRIDSHTHLQYPERSLYQALKKAAKENPKKTALDFSGRRIIFRDFLADIDLAARALSAQGIGKDDAVTICMPNMPQALILFYAASRIGAVANMIHPQSAQNEIVFALNLLQSRFILVLDMFYETVVQAVRSMDRPVTILLTRAEDELPAAVAAAYALTAGRRYAHLPYSGEGLLWKDFMKSAKKLPEAAEVPFDADHTGVVLYSGGTTGKPKGCALSDYAFNACAVQAKTAIDEEFGPGKSMLSCMPCFHGFGLGMNLHAALICGVTCILMPSFNIKTYAKLLLQKKPNFIAGVPAIFDALLNIPGLDNADLSFLCGIFCGGDTLPVSLKRRVDAFLAEHRASVQVREGYGLTESVTASCLTPKDEYREGSIGLPFPDTDYAIVKPGTCEFLPAGQTGEIVMTGPTLMQGYAADPEETALVLKPFPDGRTWLLTGDLGTMDEDGFVYFKGRIKRMIITNGYNVFPAELERVIGACEGIREVCVIGAEDPRRGQKIKAFIVPEDGQEEAALRSRTEEALKLNVARYAQPRELIFLSKLPRTEVGKIDWRALS
ncbi:MAG: acyl--CoA ligase [Lachnospiraceae bacterium]|nr:acyl--CoA ligase [Lachnospiraceae bacterium]